MRKPFRIKGSLPFCFTVAVFLATFALRVYLCLQPPVATGDLYRQLGFASHAFEDPFSFYQSLPKKWLPEAWVAIGNFDEQPYIYPPVALVFFGTFAALHLGIFWVKLTLLLADLANALLMTKFVSPAAGILFFLTPQALWYSSHEGQYESLQSLLIMLTVTAVWRGRWFTSGVLFGLAVQTKLFAVLLFPWLLYQLFFPPKHAKSRLRNLAWSIGGTVAAFLPFLPFYRGKPLLLLAPLFELGPWTYSSFFWNPHHPQITIEAKYLPPALFYWNNFGSLTIAAAIALTFCYLAQRRFSGSVVALLPYAAFWTVIKSSSYVREWYVLLAPAFLLPFAQRHKKLALLFLLLQLLVSMQGAAFILGQRRGYLESDSRVALYESCLYRCSFQ